MPTCFQIGEVSDTQREEINSMAAKNLTFLFPILVARELNLGIPHGYVSQDGVCHINPDALVGNSCGKGVKKIL